MADYRTQYVYGSTAPEREVPAYEPERRTRRVRRAKKAALSMDLPYLIMLTVAAIAAAVICCNYLKVQSSITTHIKNIEAKESALETLKTENDALEARINTMTNLDQIYRIATEELGMVYAGRDQIILYEKAESEYVRQYEDVPR